MNAYLFGNFEPCMKPQDHEFMSFVFDIQTFIDQRVSHNNNIELLAFYEQFFRNELFDERLLYEVNNKKVPKGNIKPMKL